MLRVDPERRAEVLTAAVAALEQTGRRRIILETQTVTELRDECYRGDRAMAWLLVTVCAALLLITALGIVGLGSFWVQQRTRQIGIRRALGATRGQILRYFQAENFLLATFGIALGMLLAYGINQLLMERYELGRLPARFLPVGAVSVWVLGQLAVLGPALRAASVPPAVATRTV
jgi:putative ABC transport system permease protein